MRNKNGDKLASVGQGGLPGTTSESIEDKLLRYLLVPGHPVGGAKATWFRRSLGFTQDNFQDLAKQIRFDLDAAISTELT